MGRQQHTTDPERTTGTPWRWRVIDIVVASVLSVAAGLVFVFWNVASNPLTAPLEALVPGLQALAGGGWLFAGVLVALVIRKPGAAVFGEVVAATVSALVGNQWGVLTIEFGLVQGLAAELVFALFLYRRWNLPVAVLAGAVAGLAMGVNEVILWYPEATTAFKAIYTVSGIASGAVIAGAGSWFAVKALAKTGALSRFESGRMMLSRPAR
ncbi:ECF transporter S component [Mycolicibacterium litorale]|uniref:ABC transporter permease n=1 Tax=Mycolicibacterium litorale TaxID=758802 RepID=A0AAD1INP7_9MYCO|nr:ECF transporter S component [Mycolicibacterium litorale]MCV7417469.1 ECF transporter S component [Mycolicibacterium litorale]TDY05258.1 energy-coupling factor transport system substrate-specific component [Mycolicibacterium litorale]BBY18695.1 ABC transporter permease [Mycolicibacterium litorale]